jgi:hypothetical protein
LRQYSINFIIFNLNKLSISDNGRFLVVNDGNKTPFFWLGDTGWQLFRLDRNDLDIYLETRAKQGFNVIQGPVLLSLDRDGNPYPNGDGYFPLQNMHDLNSLNSKYLEYYDYLLTKADSLGLYVCILPFWAQALNNYSINDLLAYGEKLGKYFGKYPNLIWCVGGEAAGESLPENVDALARGLKSGSQNNQLLCVHPSGFRSSSSGEYWVSETKKGNYNFQSSTWLDFNMIQSGHKFNAPNYQLIDIDYRLAPMKPTFESEYFYEDHAEWEHRNDPNPPRANATDVRKGAYWSVFAGGFGYRSSTPRTLTVGTWVTKQYIDFRDITAAGASAPWSGTSFGDCGGNSNITFPAPKTVYWNLAGANNSSANGWAATSGGSPATSNYPLAQDTAVIDNSSAGSSIDMVGNIGSISTSSRTSRG